MNSRERFLAAANCQPVDRPPIWLMRQAGRYLPEYRELKSKHDFVTMVRTPELAAEVTLQPLKRFPLDAAVIFSDILVIPEALGQGYHFRDQGGIGMDYLLDTPDKIAALDPSKITEKLNYVAEALKLTRTKMGDEKALLGFCGSPWTLACYMVEGGSAKDFVAIKKLAGISQSNSKHSCKTSPARSSNTCTCRSTQVPMPCKSSIHGAQFAQPRITKRGRCAGFATLLQSSKNAYL